MKKILLVFAALVVVFVVVAALQPAPYRVSRSVAVTAPSGAVFANVNDLHRFQKWNPWMKSDPAVKNTFEGPEAGTGAAFAWTGNSQVGAGRMAIAESRPNELVRLKLDFVKAFAGTAVAAFTFEPEGSQTLVTWNMSGEKNFFSKAIGLFVSMDKMIGGQFESGLSDLKSISEATVEK